MGRQVNNRLLRGVANLGLILDTDSRVSRNGIQWITADGSQRLQIVVMLNVRQTMTLWI